MDGCLHYVIALSCSNIITLAIYANYNIKLRKGQATLEKKVEKQAEAIKKLNGHCVNCGNLRERLKI